MNDVTNPDTNTTAQHDGRRNTLLLVLMTLAVGYLATRRPNVPVGWGEDLDAALAQATTSDRRVLIAFYMRGCAPCEIMDRDVLPARNVRKALESLVPVRLNVEEAAEVASRYGVYAAPTYVVTDSKGSLVATVMGYHTEDEFIDFLARASSPTSASIPPSGTPSPPAAP